MQKPLSRYWLIIGTSALAIAGLFSLVLVIARAPLTDTTVFTDWFHKALVVHVDLSVLVWFLSIACLMWSLAAQSSRQIFPLLEEAALVCFALGTLAITFSPLDPQGAALMSNYIPVITSPLFFLGLGLLFCGVGLMLVRVISTRLTDNWPLQTSVIIACMVIIAFIWSFHQMPDGEPIDQDYYDTLFWGGGHVLQLLHVQIVMIVWLWLTKALKPEFSIHKPHLKALFAVGLVASLLTPWGYMHYHADDQHQFFTHIMILAGGIAPTILALWILPGLITFRHLARGDKRALYSTLIMSFILFIYGGVLGALISGQNVVIPAHYHGSIVGVTLAFMGMAYLLLPQFGWRDVSSWKLAFWQPIVYGGGQFLHITGLAISGGYGVLRKTPGGLEDVSAGVKAAMGLMGIGGLLAIIGGFMFVIVLALAVWPRPPA